MVDRQMTPFTNPAREDGLVLRHWRRKRDPNTAASLVTPVEGPEMELTRSDDKSVQREPDYYFAKFNVKVHGPKYDDAQYKEHLHSEDWSREETDYLVDLALDYDLRWVVIADRYDYKPTADGNGAEPTTAIVPATKKRTMEDMKARYYDVAAKIMALDRPVSSMSAAEFDLHEKMTKFNPNQEKTRKQLADALLSRSLDEIKEEEILLGELKRIVTNEEKFLQERKELYDRLESPNSSGNTTMYQSSNGLGDLMKTLLNADKTKKRRLLLGPGEVASSSPAIGSSSQSFGGGQRESGAHRDSIGSSSAVKKGSISGLGSGSGSGAQRQLTAQEEEKYGVLHHERLTSGVQFRHDKVVKLGQAKSNVQATKISAALTELQIPPRLVMPTSRVCAEYERLINSIHVLLDVRKLSEKVEGEIKVVEAQREERERRERADRGEDTRTSLAGEDEEGVAKVEADDDDNGPEPKKEDEDEEDEPVDPDAADEAEAEDEVEAENAEGEGDEDGDNDRASTAPSTRGAGAGHKRSASAMSNVSEKSMSIKRMRK